jgi:hypothetical protein
MKNDIISAIHSARGNRLALLALASSETLDLVAGVYSVSPQYAAPRVAQRLFDAESVTIKGSTQTYGKRFSKRYDLTDENQACQALEVWGVRSFSNQVWHQVGKDIDAYYVAFEADKTNLLSRHTTTSLQLIRHSK